MRTIMIMAAALVLTTTTAAQAQRGAGVSPACRSEVVQLCPKTEDRTARRTCMMEKRASLSEACRAEIKTAMQARRAAKAAPAETAPAE